MRFCITILLLFTVVGCRTVSKLQEKENNTEKKHEKTERVYIEKKDTVFLFKPAPERSTSSVSDSSYLETSLAFSIAKIRNGNLFHEIENKKEIPIRVPAAINLTTVFITDTVAEQEFLINTETKTIERFRFLNAFFYYSGWISWIICLIIILLKWIKRLLPLRL